MCCDHLRKLIQIKKAKKIKLNTKDHMLGSTSMKYSEKAAVGKQTSGCLRLRWEKNRLIRHEETFWDCGNFF
jgi:hypothetical protein